MRKNEHPYYFYDYSCSGRLACFVGGKQNYLDKNWHTVDNHSRASSCLPYKYVQMMFLPFALPE